MSAGMGNRQDRITELARLKDGWLDGSSKAVTARALYEARILADALASRDFAIFPTQDGNIVFEWNDETRSVEITVGVNGDAVWTFDTNMPAPIQSDGAS